VCDHGDKCFSFALSSKWSRVVRVDKVVLYDQPYHCRQTCCWRIDYDSLLLIVVLLYRARISHDKRSLNTRMRPFKILNGGNGSSIIRGGGSFPLPTQPRRQITWKAEAISDLQPQICLQTTGLNSSLGSTTLVLVMFCSKDICPMVPQIRMAQTPVAWIGLWHAASSSSN
jgi:hypothetical protein